MTQVTKQDIGQWGNQFRDRQDEFDDKSDIGAFIQHFKNNNKLRKYIESYLPDDLEYRLVKHPDGKYRIDVALVDKTGKKHLLIDLERWKQWDIDWPAKYKYISFLERKSHFLEEPIPFLMVFISNRRNKILIVDKESIKKYNMVNKPFKDWGNKIDKVRQLKFSEGNLFGTNLTAIERKHFVKDSTPNLEGFL